MQHQIPGYRPKKLTMVKHASQLALCLMVLVSGCATGGPPRAFFDEDARGRYYELKNAGNVLRVDSDGTVYDITCRGAKNARGEPLILDTLLYPRCSQGWLARLGQVKKLDDDWDMSSYNITSETGRCKPISVFPTRRGRYSCWNRLWEVPMDIIMGVFGAAVLFLR